MKILQVCHYYPPHVGGIEVHASALSRKLARAGHEVTVYTSNSPKGPSREVMDGVCVHRFMPWLSPMNNPITPGILVRNFGESNFDLVHVHGHLHMLGNSTMLSSFLNRYPIVLTSHGATLGLQGWRKPIEFTYHHSLGRIMLRRADRIVALSDSQVPVLTGLGAERGRIRVIPNWIDLTELVLDVDSAAFRIRHGIGSGKLVLFVGLLTARKGAHYLLEALKYSDSRYELAIVGGEPEGGGGVRRALVDQAERLDVNDRVKFLGMLSKKELAAAYQAADLVVLPSLAEGMPFVLLEAMAYGRAVLATDIPGNRDVVKDNDNGWLVEPMNSGELGRKIDLMLDNDDLRERLGARAKADIEKKYSWDVVFGQILELYREVTAIKSGRN